MQEPLKLGVLISGRGSNLKALIDASLGPIFPAEIITVISNEPEAKGLEYATKAGISTKVIPHRSFIDRSSFEAELDREFRAADVELIALAGFMRLLTKEFVTTWKNRLVNIHPSLLPAFKGLNTHKRAIEAGVLFSGCTVHFVRPIMDEGPIIAQAAIPIHPSDNPQSLAARVLKIEHLLYPHAIRLIAEGKIRIKDDRVIIKGTGIPIPGQIINPSF